jgi:hypothetical protein
MGNTYRSRFTVAHFSTSFRKEPTFLSCPKYQVNVTVPGEHAPARLKPWRDEVEVVCLGQNMGNAARGVKSSTERFWSVTARIEPWFDEGREE